MKSWATVDRKSFVVISESPLQLFDEYRQNDPKQPEAGGILLGHRRGQHLHIIHATQPYPTDKRSTIRFVREKNGHEEEACHWWRTSQGKIGYLGEWHTHPEPIPRPSLVDLLEWAKLATNSFHKTSMLAVIVGTAGCYVASVAPDRKLRQFVEIP